MCAGLVGQGFTLSNKVFLLDKDNNLIKRLDELMKVLDILSEKRWASASHRVNSENFLRHEYE